MWEPKWIRKIPGFCGTDASARIFRASVTDACQWIFPAASILACQWLRLDFWYNVGPAHGKRPALADISPVNPKRNITFVAALNDGTNLNKVTPSPLENEFKFPVLYNQSYYPIDDRNHFFRSQIY
jgi:hypothetical protein